jgi:hypothetical protein
MCHCGAAYGCKTGIRVVSLDVISKRIAHYVRLGIDTQ